MKKHLLTCLLAVTLVAASSFTTNHEFKQNTEAQNNCFKRYQVVLSTGYSVPGTNCIIWIGILVTFDWQGNGTPVQVVSVSPPVFVPQCPPVSTLTRTGSVTSTTWDDTDAHLTDITFGTTGDAYIDGVIETKSFKGWLKNEVNTRVDAQKDFLK